MNRNENSSHAFSNQKNKQDLLDEYVQQISRQKNIDLEKIDKRLLNGFLLYTHRLYEEGKISEKTYLQLVQEATELYAEKMIEAKLAKVIFEQVTRSFLGRVI